ncbi:hypothetical protein [Salinispora arenicola]|uniref:hypothetical protein n=1 Tax=Salinispora arenicola TaxID=168697 RepID=UPI00037FA220|nr:hypothetical protein [Salinispora arenicola]
MARYLCVYADFAGVSPTELAARAHVPTTTVTDILAGRLLPTTTQVTGMTTVLSCVPETVDHLAAAADGTSTLDDSFWSIAAALDTRPPAPPTASAVVGTDPDNRATNPYTAPTTPPAAPITNRLRTSCRSAPPTHQRRRVHPTTRPYPQRAVARDRTMAPPDHPRTRLLAGTRHGRRPTAVGVWI